MTQPSLEKVFPSKEFLNQYRNKIPNQTIQNIKRKIIDSFSYLIKSQRIESDFKIMHKKGYFQEIRELTLPLLNQSYSIYFYEKVPRT